MKTKKTRIIAVFMAFALSIGGVSVQGQATPAEAAIVDAIPFQVGELVQGRYDQTSQDGEYLYYSFTTGSDKAFYSFSFNSNSEAYWNIAEDIAFTDRFFTYDRYGTRTEDLHALKQNATYFVRVEYDEKDDNPFTFRVDKYVDDLGDDAFSPYVIESDKKYSFNIQNENDNDCFEFTTGKTDYALSVSAGDGVYYNIYLDDLLTVPMWSYDKYGTRSIDLSGQLDHGRKYWIVFRGSGSWSNYDPDPYTFRMDTVINVSAPSLSLSEKKGRKVKLTWSKVSGATGYVLYRAVGYGSTFKKIKTIKANAKRTYTSKKLKKQTNYYYMVRAYKTYKGKKYYSENSNNVSKYYYSWEK